MVRFPTSRSVPPALPVLLALVLTPHASNVFAADGFPVCDIAGDQDSPSLALATDLATWVAWRDGRRSDTTVRTDVYVARLPAVVALEGVDGESAPLAPFAPAADGILACASGTAGPPIAVGTDSAGALVLWGDARTARGIYAQRLRSDGSLYPTWPADGRLISADVEDLTLAACPDGAGGAYVARKPAPTLPGTQRIVVTRITKTGAIAPGWTAAGVVIGGDDLVQGVTLAADPGGGAVFTIRLYFNGGASDLQHARGGRVSPTGVVSFETLPGWRSNGFAPGIVASLAVADGSGGFFAAWNDAPGPQFYGQHWSAAGTEQWPDSLAAPHMDALVADGAGGVYLVGREKQDLNRLSVLRRTSNGAIAAEWDAAGLLLAQPLALAHVGAIPAGGGVFAFWSELRGGGTGFDIRASQVRPNGRLGVGWVGGGDAICDMPGDQTNVVGVAGSTVLAWVDGRAPATTKKDIWAKYVLGPAGGVGVIPAPVAAGPSIRIRSVFPNPARDELRVALAAPAAGGAVRLELVDLRGRAVLRRTIRPDGESTSTRFRLGGLPAGLYWIRATQAGASAAARVTVLR